MFTGRNSIIFIGNLLASLWRNGWIVASRLLWFFLNYLLSSSSDKRTWKQTNRGFKRILVIFVISQKKSAGCAKIIWATHSKQLSRFSFRISHPWGTPTPRLCSVPRYYQLIFLSIGPSPKDGCRMRISLGRPKRDSNNISLHGDWQSLVFKHVLIWSSPLY